MAAKAKVSPDDSHVAQGSLSDAPLDKWWAKTAERDATVTLPKALAYGSKGEDLVAIGRSMASIGDLEPPEGVSADQLHAELGCFFYLRGKIARWEEAYRIGTFPSYDTLFDVTIYSMMARRIRESGSWG